MNLRKMFADAKKTVGLTTKQSIDFLKDLFKNNKKTLTSDDFRPGKILSFSYDAKDKSQKYDKTPLVLVLRRNKSHPLAINFHWAPVPMRVMLINIILKTNKGNIKKDRELNFGYKALKPLLKKLGFAPIIRLYINSRISSKGVVVPNSEFMNAAKMKSESFTGGKESAEKLYSKAVKRSKK